MQWKRLKITCRSFQDKQKTLKVVHFWLSWPLNSTVTTLCSDKLGSPVKKVLISSWLAHLMLSNCLNSFSGEKQISGCKSLRCPHSVAVPAKKSAPESCYSVYNQTFLEPFSQLRGSCVPPLLLLLPSLFKEAKHHRMFDCRTKEAAKFSKFYCQKEQHHLSASIQIMGEGGGESDQSEGVDGGGSTEKLILCVTSIASKKIMFFSADGITFMQRC